MQRWIVLGALVLTLLGGGAVFGIWKYKQGQPDRQFVPLAFNPESSQEQRERSVAQLRQALLTDAILTGIVRDTGIEAKWKLPSEQAAVEELRKRVILEAGETRLKGIPTATLNIGFKGIAAETHELKMLAERLMADVQRLVAPSGTTTSAPGEAVPAVPKF
jgi:hypothetical protein